MTAPALGRAPAVVTLSLWLALLATAGCTLPVINSDPRHSGPICPVDPIFGLPAPLLFAHRGGAREVAESTVLGFCHAKCVGADVLELDARLTKDGTFVVWHGPSLDNVLIGPDTPERKRYGAQRDRRCIGEYTWHELEHNAWVSDFDPCCAEGQCDLGGVKPRRERELITLETFLRAFPCDPINVEIKDVFVGPSAIDRFARILDTAPACPDRHRTVLVAAGNDVVLAMFRRRTGGTYPTNVPLFESIPHALQLPPLLSQPGRALQIPPVYPFATPWAISLAHRAGSAVHVFITKFFSIKGLDETPGQVQERDIHDLLDRNVDGIMTDRPKEVRPLIDSWLSKRVCLPVRPQREPRISEEQCVDQCARAAIAVMPTPALTSQGEK